MSTTALLPIRAVAKFFFEGDRKFFVKGVTYGPFKPDAAGYFLGDPGQLERSALMRFQPFGVTDVAWQAHALFAKQHLTVVVHATR